MNNVPFEAEVPQGKLILSRTDLKGRITYVNDTFAHVCGYRADELIGKPHNIIRHPDMPRSIFKQMWDTIASGKEWEGIVKNLRKDGGYYWVKARVSPLFEDNKLIGYKSSRVYVSPAERLQMDKNYSRIRDAEEGQVAMTIHLSSGEWRKLKAYGDKEKITYQDVLKQLINKNLEDEA